MDHFFHSSGYTEFVIKLTISVLCVLMQLSPTQLNTHKNVYLRVERGRRNYLIRNMYKYS
jgi:hypothetical protein